MPWAGAANTLAITFSIRTPLCYRFCAAKWSITQKIFSGFRHSRVLFSQIFAFCLFILFEYVGTDFPYLIAVPILLLSMIRITCAVLARHDYGQIHANLRHARQRIAILRRPLRCLPSRLVSLRLAHALLVSQLPRRHLIAVGIWRFLGCRKEAF